MRLVAMPDEMLHPSTCGSMCPMPESEPRGTTSDRVLSERDLIQPASGADDLSRKCEEQMKLLDKPVEEALGGGSCHTQALRVGPSLLFHFGRCKL